MANKSFKNINDLAKFIDSQEGQGVFLGQNEKLLLKNLHQAGQLLERLLQDEIDTYYDSYDPVQYKRTYDFKNSLRLSSPIKSGINEWSIEIYFDEQLADHDGAYVPTLIDEGWDIRNKTGKDIPRFTHYEGFNYVNKAVEKFNVQNKFGFQVKVIRDGQDTTGFTYSYGKQN